MALAPLHAREAAEPLQRADVAMYVATQRHTQATLSDVAHDLGLRAVAEGIETAEQLARAVEMGCDVAPGHLLARPLPPDEVQAAVLRPLVPVQAAPARR